MPSPIVSPLRNSVHGPPDDLFPNSARAVVSDGRDDPSPVFPEEGEDVQGAVPFRQYEYSLGRCCARRALAELGVAAQPLRVGRDRAPRWPQGIVGSITHCSGFVGAVVAPARRVRAIGFDAERADPLDSDLIHLVCTAPEIAWVGTQRSAPSTDWPKVIFSAKEAVHKCVSPLFGRMLDFIDVTLELDPIFCTFRAHASTPRSAIGVDLASVRGRIAITDEFVFTCAFIDSDSGSASAAATGHA